MYCKAVSIALASASKLEQMTLHGFDISLSVLSVNSSLISKPSFFVPLVADPSV